jgi:hypothetical protein
VRCDFVDVLDRTQLTISHHLGAPRRRSPARSGDASLVLTVPSGFCPYLPLVEFTPVRLLSI